MPANNSENNKNLESVVTLQPFVVLFVAVIASLLIVFPLLPVGIPNLTFSFTSINGHAPKIYWYLSRSAGLIGLSILWVAMALGLSITNKLARLWPGAPTAFAIHEYASLLGLVFAMYHGLVLMGDHFVDFSLPRLLMPFSIAYKTTWVGLGQLCFYAWLIVAISFYVRPWIGQKTWRMIHYVNFATYTMGFIHGLNSGTDSGLEWAHWYYRISAISLTALLAYRLYDSFLKKKFSLREFVSQRMEILRQVLRKTPASSPATVKSVPPALLLTQAKRTAALATTPAPVQVITASQEPPVSDKQVLPHITVSTQKEPEPQAPAITPALVPARSMPDPQAVPHRPIIKYDNNSRENKVKVRIFREPTTKPIEELQEETFGPTKMFLRLKKNFHTIPVQPTTPNRLSSRWADE